MTPPTFDWGEIVAIDLLDPTTLASLLIGGAVWCLMWGIYKGAHPDPPKPEDPEA